MERESRARRRVGEQSLELGGGVVRDTCAGKYCMLELGRGVRMVLLDWFRCMRDADPAPRIPWSCMSLIARGYDTPV